MIHIKYIVIDAWGGGSEVGNQGNGIVEKEIVLELSKYIYDRLRENGIDVFLTREEDVNLTTAERIKIIQDKYGKNDDVIIISNRLNKDNSNGISIIYALRDEDFLAEDIIKYLYYDGFNVNDFYQLRDENESSLDKEELIRDSLNNETIIIQYGNVNNSIDVYDLNNNLEKIGDSVVKGIVSYLGGTYLGTGSYTVVKGDNLYSIARKFNTSVGELKRINNLSSDSLDIGQILKLPVTNENYINYSVIKGDSLYSIAKKYNTSVDEIKRINNLSSNSLSIGQNLNIPKNEISNNDELSYLVKSGDSLYSIARTYNTTVDELKKINNLTSNNLSIGQVLKLPTSNNNYVVVKGDSLYSIARKYNTTVDELKRLNNLSSNNLSIGQILRTK